MEQLLVKVPRGFLTTDGKWIKHLTIRQINGYDEQAMLEIPNNIPIHRRALFFLERIVTFSDEKKIDTIQALRHLSIGDRVAILFNARKIILGNIIACTATCLNCSSKMSFDLNISDLLQIHRSDKNQEFYELNTEGYKIKFRPLCAIDQDYSIKKFSSVEMIGNKLVKSCVVNSIPLLPKILPKKIEIDIGMKMDDIDPLSDLSLRVSCPECSKIFEVFFPSEEFILREFAAHSKNLEHEIHWIALHYGWSESEILKLSLQKRKRYVELINATLAGEVL